MLFLYVGSNIVWMSWLCRCLRKVGRYLKPCKELHYDLNFRYRRITPSLHLLSSPSTDIRPGDLPPASDIWWWSLGTGSNLFIWGPTNLPPNPPSPNLGTYLPLVTSGDDHWRPVQTCSFGDLPSLPPGSNVWWWQLKQKHVRFANGWCVSY